MLPPEHHEASSGSEFGIVPFLGLSLLGFVEPTRLHLMVPIESTVSKKNHA